MNQATHRTAVCACGEASITVNAQPMLHGVCHCTNCKRRTGSAFGISAYFDRAAVEGRSGETRVCSFRHTAMNHDQERHFCARCGTTLFWFVSNMPDKIGIAGGCFAPDGLPEPTGSYRHNRREPWLTLPAGWQAVDE